MATDLIRNAETSPPRTLARGAALFFRDFGCLLRRWPRLQVQHECSGRQSSRTHPGQSATCRACNAGTTERIRGCTFVSARVSYSRQAGDGQDLREDRGWAWRQAFEAGRRVVLERHQHRRCFLVVEIVRRGRHRLAPDHGGRAGPAELAQAAQGVTWDPLGRFLPAHWPAVECSARARNAVTKSARLRAGSVRDRDSSITDRDGNAMWSINPGAACRPSNRRRR